MIKDEKDENIKSEREIFLYLIFYDINYKTFPLFLDFLLFESKLFQLKNTSQDYIISISKNQQTK